MKAITNLFTYWGRVPEEAFCDREGEKFLAGAYCSHIRKL